MASLGGVDTKNLELPKVDLSGLDITSFNEKAWAIVRLKIAQALEIYGGFEVIYNEISPELRNELLGVVVPELFSMPAASKLGDSEQLPYHGIYFRKPGFPFFAVQLTDPNDLSAIQEYANNIWPQGNDFFCNTVLNYSKHMQALMQIIHRMILESLGLEDHYESHLKFANYYKDVSDKGKTIALPPHKDPNYISIVCQHNVEGLEVENTCDEWIKTKPSTNSFTVLVGEAFKAWANGKLYAPNHRVKLKKDITKRYVVVFSTVPTLTNDIIDAPKELIDEQHPLLFKPFKYYDYIKYRFTEGEKDEDALKMELQNTPMTVQLGQGARIQLANAVINTGISGATIQFGSVDFPAVVARDVATSAYGIDSERPARGPHSTETSARRAHLSAPRATTA
ncbi:hypothetical protein M5K25_010524 [Dendrobium thyrsiflorum]|uniref:Fe2OG dioxygenase domain-containing protein n=1 Tax=Dendrobium thyrsiflorum TaxID=117978 RepID=A0ABD0V165_DENTH